MPGKYANCEEGNRDYQRQQAVALIANYGFSGALDFCQNNRWDGVLGTLLMIRRYPSPKTGS